MTDPGLPVRLGAVALGGAAGALARYALTLGLARWPGLPWGTLVANAIGCVAIGLLMGLFERHPGVPAALRLLVVTGLLGALTTFSTFAWDTLRLAGEGNGRGALLNVALNLGLGFGGAILGLWAARA